MMRRAGLLAAAAAVAAGAVFPRGAQADGPTPMGCRAIAELDDRGEWRNQVVAKLASTSGLPEQDVGKVNTFWGELRSTCGTVARFVKKGGVNDGHTLMRIYEKVDDDIPRKLRQLATKDHPAIVEAWAWVAAVRKEVDDLAKTEGGQKALDEIARETKMPESTYKKKDLVTAVEKVIAEATSVKFGKIHRIVITSGGTIDKQKKGLDEHGDWTDVRYSMFQAAIVDERDGRYWLSLYSFRKFSKARKAALAKWTLAERVYQKPIAKENLGK